MPCYYPLDGWRSQVVNDSGKRSIVFNPDKGFRDMPVQLGCGSCIGCKMEYARQWAIRCVHEASLHNFNSYLTLTYNDDNLPSDRSVSVRELQLFFKRLRKALGFIKIRYFACGEYGDERQRPHYHAIIFGFNFPDKLPCGVNKRGDTLYRSKFLETIWTNGYSTIGDVVFESCAYVARYTMKKQKGVDSYGIIDGESGEYFSQSKEFVIMSRRPGIGAGWFEKYGKSDTYKDFITLNGIKMGLPKFYDMILERDDPDEFFARKARRKYRAIENKEDNTLERLRTKEKVAKSKFSYLKRDLE